jgi:hypothetical protein
MGVVCQDKKDYELADNTGSNIFDWNIRFVVDPAKEAGRSPAGRNR